MNEIKLNIENLSAAEREQLMALAEKANKAKNKIWKPKYHYTYYTINKHGNIIYQTWSNDEYDIGAYELGNVFRTKEGAEEELNRRKILTKWKRLSIEAGEDKNPWDGNNEHFFMYFDVVRDKLITKSFVAVHMASIFFPSEESLENAITEIGEDNVKKYILGIKE